MGVSANNLDYIILHNSPNVNNNLYGRKHIKILYTACRIYYFSNSFCIIPWYDTN